MNHLEALWQAVDMTRCALAGKTDLTALVQQVHVRELLKLQGDWHRPCSLTQTMIQMWNLNSKLHVEIGFAKPYTSF